MASLLSPITRRLPSLLPARASGLSSADSPLSDVRLADVVAAIRHTHDMIGDCSQSALCEHAQCLRRFLTGGAAVTDRHVLALGGALVIESVKQSLDMRLYDCQLIAGLILCHGAIAQMQTGEGKTLAGLMPAVLLSLSGHGVHVASPNDYLAGRDCHLLRPAIERLGLRAGLLTEGSDSATRRAAYRRDITYGPAYAFGFDYLRDQISRRQAVQPTLGQQHRQRLRGESTGFEPLQRRLHVAIIDEIDHVLIDDAINPMVISDSAGKMAADAALHRQAAQIARALQPERHFATGAGGRSLSLTPAGFDAIYHQRSGADDSRLQLAPHEYVHLALQAAHLYQRDVHYVVVDDQVRVVDQSTGRIFRDRQWNESQHQAIQAKEGVPITAACQSLAQITRQQFYRLYDFVCGMTGTATQCGDEFRSIYGLNVAQVPLRKMSLRQELPVKICRSSHEKTAAIIDETRDCIAQGRPVLIGTPTIAKSQQLAAALKDHKLDFVLLNGTQDISEAQAIAAAGRSGSITIATNLAGRGTDIRLAPGVQSAGGLHVIVSEPNELQRADRQLVGRSARGGDPGSARVYACPDDLLFANHAPWVGRWIQRADPGNVYDSQHLARLIARVQRSVSKKATATRKMLLSQAQGSKR